MSPSLFVLSLVMSLAAADKPVEPHPVTVTFYVAGATDEKAVSGILESVKKVPSVTKAEDLTPQSGFVNVSFDSHATSFHQVAEAIAAAAPEGKRYETSMKVLVPDYPTGDNAAKIDEVFHKVETKVKIEAVDKDKGLFVVRFLPLKVDAEKKGPQGFNLGQIGHPIHDPAPKGLGLKITKVDEKPAAK
jgi:hypothetical protein